MIACINRGPAVTRKLSQRKRASARLVFGLPRQRFKKPLRMQCDTSRTVLTVYEPVVYVHSHEKVWAQLYGKLTIHPRRSLDDRPTNTKITHIRHRTVDVTKKTPTNIPHPISF